MDSSFESRRCAFPDAGGAHFAGPRGVSQSIAAV
jgi:hypothetical protein